MEVGWAGQPYQGNWHYIRRGNPCLFREGSMPPRIEKHRRTRVSIACDSCRKRKIRCNADIPKCINCKIQGEECVYASLPEDQSDPKLAEINRRLETIENLIKTNQGHLCYASAPVIPKGQDPCRENGEERSLFTNAQGKKVHLVPTFNDRLTHLKAHTSGIQESSTVYMSGVFLSILSTSDISLLSEKLVDPHLWQYLEEKSYSMWHQSHTLLGRLLKPSKNFSPDPLYFMNCVKIYRLIEGPFIHPLISPEELSDDFLSSISDPLKNGILAAVIIIGSLEMRMRAPCERISLATIREHEDSAYYQVIRSLNMIRFSQPGFIEVRLSMLLWWLLHSFSFFPSTAHFFAPIIEMAKAIGVDRSDLNAKYSPDEALRRNDVWFLLTNYQYILCIPLSMEAATPQSTITSNLDSIGGDTLKYAIGIHKIYDKARSQLFSVLSRNCSADQLLNDITSLNKELETWRESLPSALWMNNLDSPSSLRGFLRRFPADNLRYKYYYTVIAIHSIPAYDSSLLPQRNFASLLKVSDAAKELFNMAVQSQQVKGGCTLLHNCNITTAISCFLYKQLRHPDECSSYEDLRMLQENIKLFRKNIWSPAGEENPISQIWEVLIDIMARHHDIYCVNSSEKVYNEMMSTAGMDGTDQCAIT